MNILVCNVGSTSLKFKLFKMPSERLMAESKIERVGSHRDAIFSYYNHKTNQKYYEEGLSVPNYTGGIQLFLKRLLDSQSGALDRINEIDAIGFKTVLAKDCHGIYALTGHVLKAMEEYLFIAPAHNGPYLEAIQNFKELLPDTLLVGVFETAFHTTIPLERRLYAIPYEWYEKYGIMRMGYHGASHGYIAKRITTKYGNTGRLVSCHLGGSSSVCAIYNGKSVDNSFGFSLQTGLPHAARTGDLDAYIIPFLLDQGMTMQQIDHGLSQAGGLLGISGVSSDLRLIVAAADSGDTQAKLAIDILVNAVVRYAGMYYAELGGIDHLVFTGGIGENASRIREAVCAALSHMGVLLDKKQNENNSAGERLISAADSRVQVHVVPANEEIGIARETYSFCQEHYRQPVEWFTC